MFRRVLCEDTTLFDAVSIHGGIVAKAVLVPLLLWHWEKFTFLEAVEGSLFSGNPS